MTLQPKRIPQPPNLRHWITIAIGENKFYHNPKCWNYLEFENQNMRGIQVDLHVGKEDSAWGSGSDLASALNSATGKRVRSTAVNLWVNLVERRQRKSKGRRGY